MRRVLLYLAAALLMACGSGGDTTSDTSSDTGSVTVTGKIYNPVVIASLDSDTTRDILAINTPNSILNALVYNMERLPAISQGSMVTVELYVKNGHGVKYDNTTYEIGVEDIGGRTREEWDCLQCFDTSPTDQSCNIINTVQGGYFYNTVAAPGWTCSGVPASGLCIDSFPPGIDCLSEEHRWDYNGPGAGLVKSMGAIGSLRPGNTFTTTSGYSHDAADIRPSHLAWFGVRDSEGAILAQKFYVFDVTP